MYFMHAQICKCILVESVFPLKNCWHATFSYTSWPFHHSVYSEDHHLSIYDGWYRHISHILITGWDRHVTICTISVLLIHICVPCTLLLSNPTVNSHINVWNLATLVLPKDYFSKRRDVTLMNKANFSSWGLHRLTLPQAVICSFVFDDTTDEK